MYDYYDIRMMINNVPSDSHNVRIIMPMVLASSALVEFRKARRKLLTIHEFPLDALQVRMSFRINTKEKFTLRKFLVFVTHFALRYSARTQSCDSSETFTHRGKNMKKRQDGLKEEMKTRNIYEKTFFAHCIRKKKGKERAKKTDVSNASVLK